MAKSFTITTTATDTVKASSAGHAEAVFTVTNNTARPVRGLARVTPLGDTKKEWLAIAGESERDFGAGATEQFKVNFDATGGAVPAGKYPFRLDVSSAQNPDEDFTDGPTVTVEVAAPPPPPPPKAPFPIWIIFVIFAVLLVVGGVIAIVVIKSGQSPAVDATPTPTETPTETPAAKQSATFAGEWANADPNTSGVPRLSIQQEGDQLKVHAWGRCHPTDCDWGTETGAVTGKSAVANWDQKFVKRKVVLQLEKDNNLKMVMDSVYTDNRPPQHAVYDFVRKS